MNNNKIDIVKFTQVLQESLGDKNVKITVLDPQTMTEAEIVESIRELKEEHNKNNFKNN
jgi:hypothetical protein